MILINKPFLPPRDEYEKYIDTIWESNWLTNNGKLLRKLESRLSRKIRNKNLLYVTNGTIALQMAIRSLGQKGEIITTPFSFIATTSAIVWQNFTPIFCDIDESSLNIDPYKLEALITKDTKAILATHVYGNPCNVIEIEKIARKHNIKVIYDAAHAFDVDYLDTSVFNFGDISICSLHATKYYHSTEGGLIITNSSEAHQKFSYMRNFGFDSEYKFAELGINAKNSEFHAAMGLVNLKYLGKIKEKRKALSELYDMYIKNLPLRKPTWNQGATKNYAYYPIVFNSERELLMVMEALSKKEIFSRRYFYPSLSTGVPYIKSGQQTPICNNISTRTLCLPLYYDLSFPEVRYVCENMQKAFSRTLVSI